jgi:DNA-directed RNA polymerase beta subunit
MDASQSIDSVNMSITIRKSKKSAAAPAPAPAPAPAQPREWIEEPFVLIESYFKGQHLDRLVRHQIESYNHFTNFQLNRTIEMFNPIVAHSENDIHPETGKYNLEIKMSLENFKLYPPQIHENNGATKLMFPQEARLRNFTYASVMTVDVNIKYVIQDPAVAGGERIVTKVLPKINIGKLPIMLKSSICLLTQYKQMDSSQTGECKYDCGGYFIINGSEKTVLSQERAAENRVYCFCGKNTTKWSWYAEIKSVPDFKCISPKQIEVLIANKNNGFGNPIYVNIPRVKIPIELFVVFRAMGVQSDRDICERILLGSAMPDDDNTKLVCLRELLHASIMDANKYMTQEDAIRHITSYVAFVPINMDKETGAAKKREFAIEILNNDLFPHCQTQEQKIYFLGYMTNVLLQTSMGWLPGDDRDSYVNKRIELTGTLLNNLFRNYFNKLVKEIQKQTVREINSSTWKNTNDIENIINMINIYKILKPTTIENGIKRALSTGDFSIKQSNSSKVGVAQVLNRLTYTSSLSHLRRINTPMEKSGELIAPRKQHNTTWGFVCLTGDVEVLLSNRMETKKIRDLKDGDWVTTINRTTLEEEPSPIHNWFCKIPEKLFEVTTISGRKIKATPEHPLLVAREGNVYEMVKIENLLPGDKLVVRYVPIPNKNIDNEIFHKKRLEDALMIEFLKIKEFNKEVNHEMDFHEYQKEYYIKEINKYNCCILDNGAVGVPILSIVEVEPEPVYDFTTFSENHSFVASSIVSSNCPQETPEGQSIGLVKNLSYMCHVTIPSNSSPLYAYVAPYVERLEDLAAADLFGQVKVFVNGAWLGITKRPLELYADMREKKIRGIINIYTSVVFNYKLMEIRICNDGGRLTRPLMRVGGSGDELLITPEIIEKIDRGELEWNQLLCGDTSVLEYIDPEEQNCNVMCALKPGDLVAPPQSATMARTKYTHCEIHPSTILGVLGSCIPFPEHNQAPRNAYQCCMGKQSIGMYATNFDQRMDKTAYVMAYPTRPLVDTRLMNIVKLNEIPSGAQAIVAIMTHTGYNQEDSILINKGSIDRGMFMATIYHTEKDENKKINGDEQIRCRPDAAKTKGMKFGNYDKVNAQGFIPENTLVENRDIIISKVLPIKENRNDPTKTIKYEDQSKSYTTYEQTYIDKNYMSRNGDGYNFAKVRTRTLRKPVIGDKFASRQAQKGTVGNIIPEEDMPFIGNTGLRPDIIINPHSQPSRMTMSMLKEILISKALVDLGLFGDGTAFGDLDIQKDICKLVQECEFESYGNEIMYNGLTGEQIESQIFIGPCFYQRLKHMVNDKVHSRATGPMVILNRQPTEGRSKGGGLRLGEMERDCLSSGGYSEFLRERFYDAADKFAVHVCRKCGLVAAYNDKTNIHLCNTCDNRSDFAYVQVPYSFKLLSQELQTINVVPRLITE